MFHACPVSINSIFTTNKHLIRTDFSIIIIISQLKQITDQYTKMKNDKLGKSQ